MNDHSFFVQWEIDIEDVDTPREAAEEALRIHRDPDSIATCFNVEEYDAKQNLVATWIVDLYENTLDRQAP